MSSDNAVRYRETQAAHGHVESHFLKANSPDGTRAIWIKHTLFVPMERGSPALAELWAIAFADGGKKKQALKRSFRLADAQLDEAPFRIHVPAGELTTTRTVGALGELAWDLTYRSLAPSFRPYPLDAMYRGSFPRSKSLTPCPDARFTGWFQAFGERWQLAEWRGAQGHNWGPSHAHAYAWAHSNALSETPGGPPLEGAWFEALSGRVRLGRTTTPIMSVAGLYLDGKLLRFAGPRAMLSRKVHFDHRRYQLELRGSGARLVAELEADGEQLVGLGYHDPDGSLLACLNSKLARGKLTLEHGNRHLVLYTHQAALELGTRDPTHGVPMLA